MKYSVIALFLALLLASCKTPTSKYSVVAENDYPKADSLIAGRVFIVFSQSELSANPILAKAYDLFKAKNKSPLSKYLDSLEKVDAKNSCLLLAKAALNISKFEYDIALANLLKIEKSKFNPLKELLIIDMEYELARLNENFQPRKFIQKYQDLMDKYFDNSEFKNMINLRVRFLRYNY